MRERRAAEIDDRNAWLRRRGFLDENRDGDREAVGAIAALAGRAQSPAIEIAVRRHTAGVAAESGADVGELLAPEHGDGRGGAHHLLRSAPLRERGGGYAELAEAVVAPAVPDAAHTDAAGLHHAGAELDERNVGRHAHRRGAPAVGARAHLAARIRFPAVR